MKSFLILVTFFILTQLTIKSYSYSVKKCKYDAYDNEEDDNEFICYNGGLCLKIEYNSTSITKICNCKPGFTGRQCEESTLTPCSPDPCSPNGYCNSNPDSSGYFCRCKPGFTGENCQENINDCLNATCYNGGSCIDGINSYKCDCIWPYIGRYCQTKMRCSSDAICKNNGICIEDDIISGPKCICQPGYEGVDCSVKIDQCKSSPCLNNGNCVPYISDYKCECKIGFMGKNCQFKDICFHKMPCRNNATCISVTYGDLEDYEMSQSQKYYCQCKNGFTGINCDIKLDLSTKTLSTSQKSTQMTTTTSTTTSTTSSTITTLTSTTTSINTTTTQISNNQTLDAKNTNGSFVLVVNISPNEFRKRQQEIIGEFEKKFGILMSIKKELDSHNEMIYPYYPPSASNLTHAWTKVYFIFISACIQNDFLNDNNNVITTKSNNNTLNSLCLQNNVNNINDVFEVLNELKKASNLFPKYVSNVSYEAYTDSSKRNDLDDMNNNRRGTNDSTLTTTLCILSIALLVGISLALTVIIRQQNVKRIKAPIWFPPTNDIPNDKCNFDGFNTQFEMSNSKKFNDINTKQSSWSISKKFDDFSNLFFSSSTKQKTIDSPTSSENEYGDIDSSKPVKMRKLDTQIYSVINHNSSTSSSSSGTTNTSLKISNLNNNQQPSSPEFYPSPPESLPDASFMNNHHNQNILHPANYKGGSYGLTPLMLFVMGKSKTRYANQQPKDVNYLDLIDSFVHSGADLNSQNNDGETALHLAARCGLYEICERLLKNNAELNIYDNYGRNVLHTAVCANEYNIVKLLLEHCSIILGTNNNLLNNQNNLIMDEKYDLIDSKTNDELGDTSLIIASRLNYNNIIQLLIDFNATVNATDNEGRSALHWCAKVNNVNGALILLKSGANVNMQDNDEKTPLTSALNELCTLEVADVLIKFDAFVSAEDETKYNKMKSIIENLNGTIILSNPSNIKTKNDLLSIKDTSTNCNSNNYNQSVQKNQSLSIKASGTKRKLSDTLNSTNSSVINENKSNENKSNKSKKISKTDTLTKPKPKNIYTTPTPSPPPQQQQSQTMQATNINTTNPSYPINNQFTYTKQYQEYSANYYEGHNNQNVFDYNYTQQQQQQQQYNQTYLNPISNMGLNYNYEKSLSVDKIDSNLTSNGGNVNMGYLNDNSYFNYANQNQHQYQQIQQSNNPQIYSNHSYAAYF